MKVALATTGTRGDFQPYIALGQKLLVQGHSPTLLAPKEAQPLADQVGIPMRVIEPSFQTLIANAPVNVFELGDSEAFTRVMTELIVQNTGTWCRSYQEQFPDCDVLVSHPLVAPAINMAVARQVPVALGFPYPKLATNQYPGVTRSRLTFVPGVSQFLARRNDFARKHYLEQIRSVLNDWRVRELGLEPLEPGDPWVTNSRAQTAHMFAYSRHLRGQLINAPEGAVTTGPWVMSEARWMPSDQTKEYISNTRGSLAVITAGSITGTQEATDHTGTCIAAARAAGFIPLVLDGEAQGESLVDGVLVLPSAPHGQLLPSAAVLVHHGGAGTTHAACRAGVPSVTTPNNFDQKLWADTLYDHGVSPQPVPMAQLTEARLRTALQRARNPDMKHRAIVLGKLIYSEGGTGTAVRYLEAMCRGHETPPPDVNDAVTRY